MSSGASKGQSGGVPPHSKESCWRRTQTSKKTPREAISAPTGCVSGGGGVGLRGRGLLRGRRLFAGEADEGGEDVAEGGGGAGAAEIEVEAAIESVELVVHGLGRGIRAKNIVRGADFLLRFLDGAERAGGEKRENGGAEAGDFAAGNENGAAKDIGVNLIEHGIFLRDAAGIDDALDFDAVFGHAIEDDARVEGGAFDGGEELVLSRVLQIPAESNAAQVGVDEDGAVAIVPGHAEKARLAGAIIFEAGAEGGDRGAGAAGDGFENIAGGGEARFDAREGGMDAAADDAANSGDELRGARDADDAGGSADDVDDVFFEQARADGVPMSVERTDGNGDAGAEAEFFSPGEREMASKLVGGLDGAFEFFADAGEERVNFYEEFLGREAAEVGMPEPFMAHGAGAALDAGGIGDAAERGRDHVAMLEGAGEFLALGGIVAEPVEEFGEAPLGGIDAAAPVDRGKMLAVSEFGDFGGFGFGAMVAPEVILAEGRHVGGDGDDGGARRVERDGGDGAARKAGLLHGFARGRGERAHVIFMGLRGELGIFAAAMQGIFGDGGSEDALLAVHDGNADAQSTEIYASDDGHERFPLLIRVPVGVPAEVARGGFVDRG